MQALDEIARAVNRQQHQIVHGEAGQRGELVVAEPDAFRAVTLRSGECTVGIFFRAEPPRERVGLEPRAAARFARRVGAVLREQHADVHLVGFGLEPLEEDAHAVPRAGPRLAPTHPFGLAFEHPLALLRRELAPRRVERDAAFPGIFLEIVLALVEARRLPWPERTGAQSFRFVGDDQPVVDTNYAPEAAARTARTERRIEREQARGRFRVMDVAVGAVERRGEAPACWRSDW